MIKSIIERRAVVGLVVFALTVFGALAYFVQMPREASPDVKIPLVLVTTPYIGVAPKDIESLVTTPIENELASLQDLKKLTSTSAEGASIITLEFDSSVDIDNVLQLVRDRVSRARPKLPTDIEEPDIREISFNLPVVYVTISGPVSEETLKALGEEVADEVTRIEGVLEAEVTGGRERQIRVQVNPFQLTHYGLSMNDVINALRNENVNVPGGDLATGESSILLRVPGDFRTLEDLEEVAVKRVGDRPVLLGQLARAEYTFADRESYARLNGRPAVSVAVTKRSGANILDVVNNTKGLTRELSEKWPESVTFRFLGDQSTQIGDMVSDLENGIITALILVIAVLIFAMGARNSLFVAFAIPLSMLIGILVLSTLGFTLNMMVLFSLIFVLGMLVDNAIVLVENIYRHVEDGMSLFDASVLGTSEIAGALAGSTATTVAAFFPLVFWDGLMGQFMGYMPKTVIVVLLSSLAVAVFVLPVVTSMLMQKGSAKRAQSVGTGTQSNALMTRYKEVLAWSIDHRYTAVGIGLGALVVTFVLFGMFNAGVQFFPPTPPNRAIVTVRTPDGTDIETTDRIVREIEGLLLEEENVDVYLAETGVSGGGNDPMAGSQAASNLARITVDFLPDRNTAKSNQKVRVESTFESVDNIREKLVGIIGAEITVEKEDMGPPVGADVEVQLTGDNFHDVGLAAADLRRALLRDVVFEVDGTERPAIADLSDDYRVGRMEAQIRIDRAKAKRIGASTQEVGSTLRTANAGTVASTIRDGEDEYDIVVEMAPEYRDNLQALLAMRVPGRLDTSPDTFMVPLSSVATYDIAGGSGSIRHLDQDLVVTISGSASEGMSPAELRQKVQTYIDEDAQLPPGMKARLGGSNDFEKETQEFMGQALMIGLVLILTILVAQFNRYDTPVIILFTVVLSLIGVFWGLMITRMPFDSMMTSLGVISLAGVVVNNAIVLLDYVEQLRREGRGVRDALIQAGVTRFRPVILTAITTVLGLIPMAIGVSFDFRKFKLIIGSQNSAFWSPMAVAVIFGLVVATVLTLVMVPTLYSVFEDLNLRLKKRFGANEASA